MISYKQRLAWLAALALVGAFYFWIIGIGAEPRRFAWNSGLDQYYGLPTPAVAKGSWDVNGYYDLLGRAFASGHFYLPINPPPELIALHNPQDSIANAPYKLLDLVLYRRRYYLYHGAAPALLLFAPWYLVTHHDLPENFAAFLLALLGYGFLSALFLRALNTLSLRMALPWLILCLLALGIGHAVPFLLHRVKVYEIAIACGYCCVSAGFYFLFRCLTAPSRNALWAALAGLSFGLAAGARPHLALAAAAGFVVVALVARRNVPAFALPVIACGLAIAAYNYARFHDPLEFGLRYQLAENSYQNIRLAMINEVPGLYYLLLCSPDLVPEFPYVRLAWRQPFDADTNRLPARYFAEPTDGILVLCPLACLAILLPLVRKRMALRKDIFAFLLAILAFAVACILFIAATGLNSQRFEVDFAPFLALVGCIVACVLLAPLRGLARIMASTVFAFLLLYTIGANAALALQGPYDQFVQASPAGYVKLSRWFSPLDHFRLLANPELRVKASFDFSFPCAPGVKPLITTGEFGSRYLLSEACYPDGKLQLWSDAALESNERHTVDVPYAAGMNLVSLHFTPADRTMIVSWNGAVVLRHRLRFLVAAPSQIYFGWDPTWSNKITYPGKIAVFEAKLLPGGS